MGLMSKNGVPIIQAPPVKTDPQAALEQVLKDVGELESVVIVGLKKDGGLYKALSDIKIRDLHYLGGIIQEIALGPHRAHEQAKALQQAMASNQIREITEKVTSGEA